MYTKFSSISANQKFSGGFRGTSVLESEVTESGEFDTVSDDIRRWSNLSERESVPVFCQNTGTLQTECHLTVETNVTVETTQQTECHLTVETNVEQIFSRTGQLKFRS